MPSASTPIENSDTDIQAIRGISVSAQPRRRRRGRSFRHEGDGEIGRHDDAKEHRQRADAADAVGEQAADGAETRTESDDKATSRPAATADT